MAKETAHLTGCGPEDKPLTKREKLRKFQEDFDSHGFNLRNHGDEVIVSLDEDDKIRLKIKIQESLDTFRVMFLTFDTQTQVERLLPSIMKGMRRDHRG